MQDLTTTERDLASVTDRDVLQMLLADKRSENTKRAYKQDIKNFFLTMTGKNPAPELVSQFLSLPRPEAIAAVLRYKAGLLDQGLAEATVNRRLAAIKSLVSFARKLGQCGYDLEDISGEKVQAYRDVSGVTVEQIIKMLSIPDQGKIKGKRDYAILRLLWENAVRRNELVSCDIQDYDHEAQTLAISGKGRGTQKENISLSEKTVQAINQWLQTRSDPGPGEPLFISLSNYQKGHRMTGTAVYDLISSTAKAAGISKQLSPHRIRHSAITAALEHLNGNVTKVQQLSRHKSINTVMVYNDRRKNEQGEVSNLLSALT